jgi:hypothetical protein
MRSTRKHQQNFRGDAVSAADPCKTRCADLPDLSPQREGDFIDQTIAIWQKRAARKLTREDGREIIENITGFFSVLQEWERKERTAEYVKATLPTAIAGRSPRTARKA